MVARGCHYFACGEYDKTPGLVFTPEAVVTVTTAITAFYAERGWHFLTATTMEQDIYIYYQCNERLYASIAEGSAAVLTPVIGLEGVNVFQRKLNVRHMLNCVRA